MKKPLKTGGKKTRFEGVGGGDFEMALDTGSKAKVDDFPPIDGGNARVCSKALQANEFELEDEPLSLSEEEAAFLYSAPATTATHTSETIPLESSQRGDAPPRNKPSAGLQVQPNEAARKVSNAIQSNKKQTRANIVVEVRPGVTIPWSQWAGLERDRYNENGPPLNTSERLYEAMLTQQGMLGEAQRQYGATRTHFIALVQEEAGLSDAAAINVRLNKELERTANVQQAIVAVARTYLIDLATVTESFRERIPFDTDEGWENHWKRSQTGFLKCRMEARLAAKQRIAQETTCSEQEALERFGRHFKASGKVEESILESIKEERVIVIVEAAEDNSANTNPSHLNLDNIDPSKPVCIATDGTLTGAAGSVLLQQHEAEDAESKELRLMEEVDALSFKMHQTEYHRKRPFPPLPRGSNPIDPEDQQAQAQLHRLQDDGRAKAVALEAIAAATGQAIANIEPILTEQLQRFRGFADAVRATADLIRVRMTEALLRPATTYVAAQREVAIEHSPAPLLQRGANTEMPSSILQDQTNFSGYDSPVQFSAQLQEAQPRGTLPNIGFNHLGFNPSGRPPIPKPQKTEKPLSLRDIYAQTIHEESSLIGDNGMRLTVQIDRPVMWVDVSLDPKYLCAGWSVTAYTNWKEHAEKRKAQGARQKFVTYITLPMLDMLCAMTRSTAEHIVSLSDEALTLKLDLKFNIAQETNLLLMKFAMPARPANLHAWELHLPTTEWNQYVSRWLKELRNQQEAGKNLEIYNLSDVFSQSVQSFKLLYDHSRVITRLEVRDLIASCSDHLQEQVLIEQRSVNARKQQGLEVGTKTQTPAQEQAPANKNDRRAFTPGNGPMTIKQARAFMTEASALMKQPPPAQGGGGAARSGPFQGPLTGAVPRDGMVAFHKLPIFTVGCEGCGKWYQNFPDRKYPYACSGRCQYEGHPALNTKYQQGVKWKHPGFCLTWKGVQDKDIPAATLARLQTYSAAKRDRPL